MNRTTKLVSPVLFLLLACSISPPPTQQVTPQTSHPATDVYDGWRLAIQAWTFSKYTFYEAIEKTAALGLDWIEAYPGQSLSKENPDLKFDDSLPPEFRKEVKRKLASEGLRLVNYGVVNLPNDEVECRKVFDFANDMGIETITSEPPEDAFDLVDRLCREYGINVSIHNHPKPSYYWSPDKILEVCKGRSKWIGACADIGHWMRSGVDPVEAIKKLEGRVISLHFGDLNEFGQRDAHDVAWGTGKADIEAILTELHRQNFAGVFSVEFEYDWYDSMPEIRQSIEYFNKLASKLNPTGWRDLVASDLSNCILKPATWAMEDGILVRKGGGYIWTKERYEDFVVDLEFKLDKATNSGVFLRTADLADFVQTSIEVQIHETTDGSRHGANGAIYDCLSPSKNALRKTGEWNHYTISCKGNKIMVVLNGEQIIDMDLDQWTVPHKNPDGTPNKFRTALKDMAREGHIGFQDHGQPIWFRNIKIRTLTSD